MPIIITVMAFTAIVIHAIFPDYKIDLITLGLFIVALLPWLSYVFESFELPGGWKFKFKYMEETGKRAEKVGLISSEITQKEIDKYSFQVIGESDPNLALAGLRIEIEKRLKMLAENNNIGTRMQGVGRLIQMLSDKELLGNEESSVMLDMIELLNSAVHGAKIDNQSYVWTMEYGPRILKTLDKRIAKRAYPQRKASRKPIGR